MSVAVVDDAQHLTVATTADGSTRLTLSVAAPSSALNRHTCHLLATGNAVSVNGSALPRRAAELTALLASAAGEPIVLGIKTTDVVPQSDGVPQRNRRAIHINDSSEAPRRVRRKPVSSQDAEVIDLIESSASDDSDGDSVMECDIATGDVKTPAINMVFSQPQQNLVGATVNVTPFGYGTVHATSTTSISVRLWCGATAYVPNCRGVASLREAGADVIAYFPPRSVHGSVPIAARDVRRLASGMLLNDVIVEAALRRAVAQRMLPCFNKQVAIMSPFWFTLELRERAARAKSKQSRGAAKGRGSAATAGCANARAGRGPYTGTGAAVGHGDVTVSIEPTAQPTADQATVDSPEPAAQLETEPATLSSPEPLAFPAVEQSPDTGSENNFSSAVLSDVVLRPEDQQRNDADNESNVSYSGALDDARAADAAQAAVSPGDISVFQVTARPMQRVKLSSLDPFSVDYLVVPVNGSNHWSVCVVMYPALLLRGEDTNDTCVNSHADLEAATTTTSDTAPDAPTDNLCMPPPIASRRVTKKHVPKEVEPATSLSTAQSNGVTTSGAPRAGDAIVEPARLGVKADAPADIGAPIAPESTLCGAETVALGLPQTFAVPRRPKRQRANGGDVQAVVTAVAESSSSPEVQLVPAWPPADAKNPATGRVGSKQTSRRAVAETIFRGGGNRRAVPGRYPVEGVKATPASQSNARGASVKRRKATAPLTSSSDDSGDSVLQMCDAVIKRTTSAVFGVDVVAIAAHHMQSCIVREHLEISPPQQQLVDDSVIRLDDDDDVIDVSVETQPSNAERVPIPAVHLLYGTVPAAAVSAISTTLRASALAVYGNAAVQELSIAANDTTATLRIARQAHMAAARAVVAAVFAIESTTRSSSLAAELCGGAVTDSTASSSVNIVDERCQRDGLRPGGDMESPQSSLHGARRLREACIARAACLAAAHAKAVSTPAVQQLAVNVAIASNAAARARYARSEAEEALARAVSVALANAAKELRRAALDVTHIASTARLRADTALAAYACAIVDSATDGGANSESRRRIADNDDCIVECSESGDLNAMWMSIRRQPPTSGRFHRPASPPTRIGASSGDEPAGVTTEQVSDVCVVSPTKPLQTQVQLKRGRRSAALVRFAKAAVTRAGANASNSQPQQRRVGHATSLASLRDTAEAARAVFSHVEAVASIFHAAASAATAASHVEADAADGARAVCRIPVRDKSAALSSAEASGVLRDEATAIATRSRGPPVPAILLLDSLKVHSTAMIARVVRDWLAHEAVVRGYAPADFRIAADVLPAMQPAMLPRQTNSVDCGIFAIGYVERLLCAPGPPHVTAADVRAGGSSILGVDWDIDAEAMRNELRAWILNDVRVRPPVAKNVVRKDATIATTRRYTACDAAGNAEWPS